MNALPLMLSLSLISAPGEAGQSGPKGKTAAPSQSQTSLLLPSTFGLPKVEALEVHAVNGFLVAREKGGSKDYWVSATNFEASGTPILSSDGDIFFLAKAGIEKAPRLIRVASLAQQYQPAYKPEQILEPLSNNPFGVTSALHVFREFRWPKSGPGKGASLIDDGTFTRLEDERFNPKGTNNDIGGLDRKDNPFAAASLAKREFIAKTLNSLMKHWADTGMNVFDILRDNRPYFESAPQLPVRVLRLAKQVAAFTPAQLRATEGKRQLQALNRMLLDYMSLHSNSAGWDLNARDERHLMWEPREVWATELESVKTPNDPLSISLLSDRIRVNGSYVGSGSYAGNFVNSGNVDRIDADSRFIGVSSRDYLVGDYFARNGQLVMKVLLDALIKNQPLILRPVDSGSGPVTLKSVRITSFKPKEMTEGSYIAFNVDAFRTGMIVVGDVEYGLDFDSADETWAFSQEQIQPDRLWMTSRKIDSTREAAVTFRIRGDLLIADAILTTAGSVGASGGVSKRRFALNLLDPKANISSAASISGPIGETKAESNARELAVPGPWKLFEAAGSIEGQPEGEAYIGRNSKFRMDALTLQLGKIQKYQGGGQRDLEAPLYVTARISDRDYKFEVPLAWRQKDLYFAASPNMPSPNDDKYFDIRCTFRDDELVVKALVTYRSRPPEKQSSICFQEFRFKLK